MLPRGRERRGEPEPLHGAPIQKLATEFLSLIAERTLSGKAIQGVQIKKATPECPFVFGVVSELRG